MKREGLITQRDFLRRSATAAERLTALLLAYSMACILLSGVSIAAGEDWQYLFDGKTLNGWVQRNGQANYTVEEGMIVGSTVLNTPNSFLCTEKMYTDFILELEFLVEPGMNSGIQIRSNSFKHYKDYRVHGYQVEIDTSARAWSGGIYDEARRGWLYPLKDKPEAQKAFKQNQWNHYRIEAIGDRIRTWVNGVSAADLKDDMTSTGFIALQVHSSKEAGKKIKWRNIRIQDLSRKDNERALNALIVDGQNNHDWKGTTPVLKSLLEETGLFVVDVATSPAKGQPMDTFRPNFTKYDVIVSNYTGADWPKDTQDALVEYMKNGGGLVIFHAADNAFPKWKEWNEMIALGGWGGRNEESGPMVRYRNGKVVLDDSPGRGGTHGPQHEFQVVIRDRHHPITAGLPEKWMHTKDELYSQLRGPAKNMTVLATAYADPAQKGTGEHEPVLFTVRYGKGRVFHTVLGHAPEQLRCVGFIVTFQRGSEWAATGRVTQVEVPADFPTADKVSLRASLSANYHAVEHYNFGRSGQTSLLGLPTLRNWSIEMAYPTEQNKTSDELRGQFIKDFSRISINTTLGDAMMLRILVESMKAKRGIEVGSANGFGAINMGIGFERTGGHLYTLEINPKMVKECRENLKKVGLENTVTCMEGDALKTLPTLQGEFDFVFIDAVKRDYFKYLKLIEPKLKPGAVIVGDNVIRSAKAMKDFLDYIQESPNYDTVIIRASMEKDDGMSVSYKIR